MSLSDTFAAAFGSFMGLYGNTTLAFYAASSAVDSRGGPNPALGNPTTLLGYIQPSATDGKRDESEGMIRAEQAVDVFTLVQPTVNDGGTVRVARKDDRITFTPKNSGVAYTLDILVDPKFLSDSGSLWKCKCLLVG